MGFTDGLSAKLLRIFIYALLTQGGDSVAETISEGKDVLPALVREGVLIYDDKREGTHGEARREGEGNPEGAELDGAPNAPSGNDDNNGVPRDGDRSPGVPTDGDIGLLSDKGAREEASEEIEEEAEAGAESITFEATAYTADCEGCIGITKTGVDVRNSTHFEGKRVIAVDPAEIPLGSEVTVTLENGTSFEATAQDIGGAIKGRRIDVLVGSYGKAVEFGRQSVEISVNGES